MKLEKFKKYGKRNKKIICSVIGITIIIGIFILFKSFAFFESKHDFDVIKGRIPNFTAGDVTLAFSIDGVKSNDVFPIKDGGYTAESVTCSNGVTAEWNNNLWGLVNVKSNGQKKVNCNIDFKSTYEEILLNGSYPTLGEEMIPITIGTGGVVIYANKGNQWYNYEKKQWANAVILTSAGKNKNYTVGSTIAEEDIESYFVWIPKYAYKIQSLGNNRTIAPFEIRFGITNTVDNDTECIAPNVAGQNGKCAVGKYMTHPAFTDFGEVKGLWVGKFETTGSVGALTVKPNLSSLTNQNIVTFFNSGHIYKRNLDSHMMKNTEWGAMAYLTNSIYGKCDGYTCEEVYINNNSDRITGWSATTVSEGASTTSGYSYNNANSVKASTTGNYSGIYGTSGGASDAVMAILYGLSSSYSGFSSMDINKIEKKYYNNYDTPSRILGDATFETYAWFYDSCRFALTHQPYFRRGGTFRAGVDSSPFSFDDYWQEGGVDYGFRLVLAPI